ncbi:hypothetical protein RI367_004224 [Sorochytrium milnesiophthora]
MLASLPSPKPSRTASLDCQKMLLNDRSLPTLELPSQQQQQQHHPLAVSSLPSSPLLSPVSIHAQIRRAIASSHYRGALFNGLLSSSATERASALSSVSSALRSWASSLYADAWSRSESMHSDDLRPADTDASLIAASSSTSLLVAAESANRSIARRGSSHSSSAHSNEDVALSQQRSARLSRVSSARAATDSAKRPASDTSLTRSASTGSNYHSSSFRRHPPGSISRSTSGMLSDHQQPNGDSANTSLSYDGADDSDDEDANKQESVALFHLHLLTVLRLSIQCPYADVRSFMMSLLDSLKSQGVPTPRSAYTSPSYFVPLLGVPSFEDVQSGSTTPTMSYGTSSDITEMMSTIFNTTGRFTNLQWLLAYFPVYLRKNWPMFKHVLMGLSGPLPRVWRLYIGIMAAAQYQCQVLVSYLSQEFLLAGGEVAWLDGLTSAPQRLQNLQELNMLLAHQPWRITPKHIGRLIKGTGESPGASPPMTPYASTGTPPSGTTTSFTNGTGAGGQPHSVPSDNWAMSELIQAIVVMSSVHGLSSFSLASGVVPEVDSVGGFVYDYPDIGNMETPTCTNSQVLQDAHAKPTTGDDRMTLEHVPTMSDSVAHRAHPPPLPPHIPIISTSGIVALSDNNGGQQQQQQQQQSATTPLLALTTLATQSEIDLTDQLIQRLKRTQEAGVDEDLDFDDQEADGSATSRSNANASPLPVTTAAGGGSHPFAPDVVSDQQVSSSANSAISRKEVFEKCENLAGLPVDKLLGPLEYPSTLPDGTTPLSPTAIAGILQPLPLEQLQGAGLPPLDYRSALVSPTSTGADNASATLVAGPTDGWPSQIFTCAHRPDVAWPPHFEETTRFTVPDKQIAHEDFNVKATDYSVFRLNDWSWEDHGVGLISKYLGHEVGEMLDDVFEEAKHMTDYSLFNIAMSPNMDGQSAYEGSLASAGADGLDTAPFRQAVWYYVLRLYGQCHDDYDYARVNHFLNKRTKSFVKKVACCPQAIQYSDFQWMGVRLRPEEKCHINVLVVEAKKQAQLVWALNSVVKYLEKR